MFCFTTLIYVLFNIKFLCIVFVKLINFLLLVFKDCAMFVTINKVSLIFTFNC